MELINVIINHMLHGLVYGMLLFVVSVGLTIVFGMMNVLSIAHAAFYMLGAYIAFSIISLTGNFWLSLVLAPVIVGIVGYLVEYFLLRRVHSYGHGGELLLTLGVFFVIQELIKVFWGDFPRPLSTPALFAGKTSMGAISMSDYSLFIIVAGLIVCAVIMLVLQTTRIGIIIRSMVSDVKMTGMLGINTGSTFLYVYAVSAALAGLGGVIAAPFLSTFPGMGMDMMIDMFIVVVVGGFGSIVGALVSSILIGLLQSFGVLLLPQIALIFKFLLMAAILIVRPQGLFGEKS
jgi:branched-chain amino acid transport system permease protein